MIGGPLTAAINAQTEAALATVEFITTVGKKDDTDEPTTVQFVFDANGDGTSNTITVPVLTVVPIPNIVIKDIDINFNAKITAMDRTTNSTVSKLGISAEAKASWGWGSAKIKASYSRQKSSSRTGEVKKEYNMNVHVKAGQDDPPPGIETLIEKLNESIKIE